MLNFFYAASFYLKRWVQPGIINKNLIKQFLPEDPIIIDAGAHVGSDTIEMSKLWPKSIIHAFEPVPELFNVLEKKTYRLRNVICYPLALSDQTGKFKMFISSGASDASSSLIPPKEHLTEHPDVFFHKEIIVQTITIDEWAKRYGIKRIDLLWLDMQGHELATLKAAGDILKTVRVIHTEVSLKEVYKCAPLYSEVREWLEDRGFQIECEELPWSDMGNVLFVRKGHTGG